MRPGGTRTAGTPAASARARRAPPAVTTTDRHRRRRASSKQARVSAVSPEYEDATTSAPGPHHAGSVGDRTTSTGIWSRSATRARSTSPATAEPPMPQTARARTSAAETGGAERPIRYPSRHCSGSAAIDPSIPPGSPLEIATGSSRSITGAFSRWAASRPRRSASPGYRPGSGTGSRSSCKRGPAPAPALPGRRGRSGTPGSRGARGRASRCSSFRSDDGEELGGLLLEELLAPCFHVQTYQRLRVRGSHVEPPVVELDREPVGPVLPSAAEDRGHRIDRPIAVGNAGVDLAGRVVAAQRTKQLGQGNVRDRELLESDDGGDQARVGPVVVPEVVVTRMLAPEDRAGLGHHLLDERVAHARADGRPAALPD